MCQYRSAVVTMFNDNLKIYTLDGEDSHEDIREKYNIKDDYTTANRQEAIEFIPTGMLFDYKSYELRWDDIKPDWATPDVEDKIIRKMINICKKDDLSNYKGYLYLYSLTSIPEGTTLSAGGYLYLSSLTSIPEGVTLSAGGDLNLESLTSIPKGVKVNAQYILLKS